MPKTVINSFNAGELSPYLYARSDFEKYRSGCLVMENFVPLPYGGATRRPALEYIGDSKQDDKIRLIPFTASVEASYVLELGDGYVRFWKDGERIEVSSVPVEVGSPWTDTELNAIKFAQSVDVMWLVHPDHAPQRISRFSDTSWTISDEQFDYPPLLEENDTDITMSPSATTGTITLTSSQDFFDVGHVGSFMSFNAPRLTANRSASDKLTATGVSDELYVSNANWEVSTTDSWAGLLILQRSLDSGTTWEDYITIGDTTGATATGFKNFTISSDGKETTNTRIRLQWIRSDGNLQYLIKTDDEWSTLVKITAYTDAKNVTADVLDEFQDIASDYNNWTTTTGYVVGNKVKIDGGITYASNNVNLTAINAGLTDIVGSDFGGGYFWFVTNGASNKKIWKLDSGLTAVESGFPVDISSNFTNVSDIAWYSSSLYITGGIDVKEFTDTGTFISTKSTLAFIHTGIGYYNNFFYIGNDSGFGTTLLHKYTTSFNFTGIDTVIAVADGASDITGHDGSLYVANNSNDSVDIYNESLVAIGSQDISTQTTSPQGIAWDGTSLWVTDSGGVIYEYNLVSKTTYYECVEDHTSGTFSADLANGYWAVRTPIMTTWTEGAFSDYRGHPSSIALFESRLFYAGTATNPDTIWASQIDDYSNFQLGSLDTDAMKLTLNSGKIDEIRWLVPQERLVIGTAGSEWSLGASDERKPITPTGFDLKRKTTYGSSSVQAILVNSAVLMLMRQGRKVREWTPNYNLQDYVAPDLSILAEHITEGGVQLWDYQQQPDNILWSIRADGTLLGFTYERDQNVTGWHRHSNDGFIFESLAIIPRDNEEDEVYVSINIGGTRSIARLNDREWGTDYANDWQGSDLWVDYQSSGDALHLAGKTVDIVIDGAVQTQQVVDGSGNITGTLGTHNIVGLPFTSTIAPVYLNSANNYGTSQGSKTDVRTGTVRFKDTFSAKVGQTIDDLESVEFDSYTNALYSEDAEVWFNNASEFLQSCYIVQEQPMPCTVLALIAQQEVGR